ncbi:MAG: NmrA family NAD(P)-binding protein [Nitrospinae bacterium]|nr:NmrA family NAD(P)-binding protein [Nitrospinota bacterium]
MTTPKVLVTGAGGKTASYVVEQLIEEGFPVRALVRRLDERSDRLTSLGAEVVVGDFLDIESLRSAMAGLKRAYFCYPPADRLLEATTNFAIVAKEVSLEALVNMSQFEVRDAHPSHLANQHWLGERVLEWADVGVTHIRPTFFAEMSLILNGKTIASEGKMYLPYGDGKHAPVSAEDIARVVVGVLTNPGPHTGEIYKVTGPEDLSIAEIAEIFNTALGKPVEYVDIPLEVWQKALADLGLSPFLIQHLGHMAEDHKNGFFAGVTDVVHKVGGRQPQSLEDFIRANAQAFGA